MTPEQLAFRARELMNEDCMKQAFADLREKYVKRLESPAPGDTVPEHELVLSLQLLVALKRQLLQYGAEEAIIEHRKKHDTFVNNILSKVRRQANA